MQHFDVLIIGAGLSGIGAGARLRMDCPEKSFAILEGREASGGTWDLFRYPGIRSDSDMFTLGYRFRPWSEPKAIADGPSILNYIRETATEYNLDKEIRYGHRVRRAAWSSEDSQWTVEAETRPVGSVSTPGKNGTLADAGDPDTVHFTCKFLYLCTGYYDYTSGYTPEWPGFDDYTGTVVHPQKWPEDLDYEGKNVVVIGSGATAVTLVPAMAKTAAHVTMLQRSPTYVVTMPAQDKIANFLRSILPARAAYMLSRWKNVFRQMFFYQLSRKRPSFMKRLIAKGVRSELGADYPEEHFTPDYNPWDQRLCIVPDSDLFKAIRDGRASVVTSEIDTFTATGVRLKSGDQLDADIIVTATGLVLKIMAGLELVVDGAPVELSKLFAYKGMMYSDVPNLAQAFGYTNASWTLKCDLTSEYVCRLIKYMDDNRMASCVPRLSDPAVKPEPVLDFNSGYVIRALGELPSQGSKHPWRLHQNYVKDLSMLRYGRVDDGTMEFRPAER
ncbi:MAG TPA: NAD(P)/FAD-dependent oxidoreductase [Pyrinomonadaceae bacterium]|nr:NAD(P)/FAD-dependent oxidoreductase [Chloracidobacterium sp.]MBP9935543.1 NAD(P)/FAD-dependent oxidoreductase [Pyrinomonadaceae bacterium]MBK7801172.1 NAD(P)/FAD-dependent oxidoreductase [Chloracidobacterium sp.]MBK9436494.1 NAD(P)/FAD-dependent oxidoreductase [Chloracidobacterium sp.]MBL0241477.1 NAD(P)/FAD-dependent oxidoreductase [Chloracidobacterium sp.]